MSILQQLSSIDYLLRAEKSYPGVWHHGKITHLLQVVRDVDLLRRDLPTVVIATETDLSLPVLRMLLRCSTLTICQLVRFLLGNLGKLQKYSRLLGSGMSNLGPFPKFQVPMNLSLEPVRDLTLETVENMLKVASVNRSSIEVGESG
jgi:hypothetical protein